MVRRHYQCIVAWCRLLFMQFSKVVVIPKRENQRVDRIKHGRVASWNNGYSNSKVSTKKSKTHSIERKIVSSVSKREGSLVDTDTSGTQTVALRLYTTVWSAVLVFIDLLLNSMCLYATMEQRHLRDSVRP